MIANDPEVVNIPKEVFERVRDGMGGFFSKLNHVPAESLAKDMLNPAKAERSYEVLTRFTRCHGVKILEVGSGYGINLIYWTKHFGMDVTGVEPESYGFSETIEVSKQLCKVNGVSPEKIVVSQGEILPFADASFDVVYSSNMLEHTNDPVQVLREALRVLKPGGILHFEMPNFMSYFEGHYFVVMPPIFCKRLLPWWVHHVFGRDPGFAATLRTEINPIWLQRTVRILGKETPIRLISMGEEIFRERMSAPSFNYQQKSVGQIIAPMISLLRRLNIGGFAANLFILVKGYYPSYLTIAKE